MLRVLGTKICSLNIILRQNSVEISIYMVSGARPFLRVTRIEKNLGIKLSGLFGLFSLNLNYQIILF